MSSASSIAENKSVDAALPNKESEKLPDQITSDPDASNEFNPGWRFYLAFISLTVITLMVALDATSLSVALPIMANVLNGSSLQAFWSGTSFLLTSTVFQPVLGSLSEIFGRLPMVYISLVLFGLGAILAAVANDFNLILAGRSIQGLGGGGVITLTEIIVTDLVPLRLRGQWFSFISSAWALGTVTGPLLGGGFSQNVSWRWIFWINLPFIGVGGALIALFLRLNFKTTTFVDKLRRVDWIGAVLFIGSTTGLLMGISWGGIMYPWSAWQTLVPIIVCAFGFAAFVVYEEWITAKGKEPLIRLDVLKSRTAAVTYFGTVIHGFLLWCTLYYVPFYFEGVKDYSAIRAGISLMPQTLTVAPFSIVAGVVAATTGHYRWAIHTGWLFTTVGFGLFNLYDLNTSTVVWVVIGIVGGIGTGMLFAAMALSVQASSTSGTMSHAVIMFAFLRAFGQTIGVAVGGVVFQNVMKQKLLTYPLLAPRADELARDSSALIETIKSLPLGDERTFLLEGFMAGMKGIFILCSVLAGLAFVASLFTEALPLDRALETDQGFQHEKRSNDEENR